VNLVTISTTTRMSFIEIAALIKKRKK